MTIIVLYDFNRIGQILEDNTFFFSFFDFHHICRHFIFSSSVNIINRFCSESHCCSAGVHSSISATYYRNFASQVNFFISDNLPEEIDTAYYTLSIFTFAADTCGYPCPYSQQHSIKISSDGLKRDISTDLCVGDNFNSHLFYYEYLLIKYCFRESVFRNSVSEHSACFRHSFENSYLMAHLSQEISCRKSHRTAAYNCDTPACIRFTFRNKSVFIHKILISGKSLEPLY